ncbi:hypothetical protein GQ53DRAFT_774350 [Thozetella sp. PMI_491]|nr:hypothetical protein GQ53DRAFT_774350 [Thozetella sp. PMI_491]
MEAYALRAALDIILFAVELDQVPRAVGRCLELVRTCHADIQHLIELRNEYIEILSRRPKELERVNRVIENANRGLMEVCKIVEKCRPEANNGRTGFRARLWWMWMDSAEFKDQQPIISRQHSAVIAELTYLRQLGLMTPIADMAKKTKTIQEKRKAGLRKGINQAHRRMYPI